MNEAQIMAPLIAALVEMTSNNAIWTDVSKFMRQHEGKNPQEYAFILNYNDPLPAKFKTHHVFKDNTNKIQAVIFRHNTESFNVVVRKTNTINVEWPAPLIAGSTRFVLLVNGPLGKSMPTTISNTLM